MREAVNVLVQLFAPMMPHLAEECWASLGQATLVAQAPWPKLEPDLLIENTVTLPVQINGKKRAEVTVPRDAKPAEIEAAVLALDAVKRALDGKRAEEGDRGAGTDRQCGGVSGTQPGAALARVAVVLAAAGLTAGCFQPLLGTQPSSRDHSVRDKLEQIDVPVILAAERPSRWRASRWRCAIPCNTA